MGELIANILRIERISISDGYGMRTVVFFKGCPLRCAWCSTPESWAAEPEVYYRRQKCVGCGKCVEACPNGALTYLPEIKQVVRDRGKCTNCMACVRACRFRAWQIYGKKMTVKQVFREIQKDELFYFHSGGGVTLSGGDVFCYPEFVRELLMLCRESAINSVGELAMFTSPEKVDIVVPHFDSFYVDVKCMDPAKHRKWTGQDNALILDNIRRANRFCRPKALCVRIPLIEGVNDDAENLLKTAQFCTELDNCEELELLPYHRLGIHAYEQMGIAYALRDRKPMERSYALEAAQPLLEGEWPFRICIAGETIRHAGS